MNTVFVPVFILYTGGILIQAFEVAREVESGVELLNTGSIQLIIPKYLSFIIKNQSQCVGFFRTCYLSEPALSRIELRQKYSNVGWKCPPKTCTLSIEPEKGVFGLAMERHDGNYYGMFVDGTTSWCPRHIVDGRMNLTVINMPDCPVIIDGALLPKDDAPEPKRDSSMKWYIIGICVGTVVL
uniref:Secreted protein n=1 Tax=Panagrellus redivivus TaxID=6233 RepID=A0A7E4W3K8_PANRE